MKRWAAVCRLGGVGDNLVAGSVLAPLKRLGYMTEVITSTPNHVVYLHNPHIDKLAVKDSTNDLPQNDMLAWQKWMESRAREYDIFVHASHSMEGRHALFDNMTSFWLPAEHRREICAGSYLETIHKIAGVPFQFGPLYFSSPEEIDNAHLIKAAIGGECIVWVVAGSRYDKAYPKAGVAIAHLIRDLGVPVVVMGGPNEKDQALIAQIKQQVEHQNGNRTGLHLASPSTTERANKWPLRVSLTFAQQADLVVSPDTGPAWAVAFEPMPKVILVSHASAENITKHWRNTITLHADQNRVPCWPCHRLHNNPSTCVENADKTGAACMSDIGVEQLLEAIYTQWQSRRRSNVVEFAVAQHAHPAGQAGHR